MPYDSYLHNAVIKSEAENHIIYCLFLWYNTILYSLSSVKPDFSQSLLHLLLAMKMMST